MAAETSIRNYPEKNLLPFKREDYIRQPNSVSRMEYKMELIQLRAFACFLERIEPLVLKLLDRYNADRNGGVKKMSIFDLEESKSYINRDGLFMIEFPVKDLGVGLGYYGRAKEIIKDMVNLKIRFTTRSDDGEKREAVASAFYVDVSVAEGKKKVKTIRLGVIRSVLDKMIDVSMGYRDQLKRIAFMASNIYTARMYVFTSAHLKNDGKSSFEVTISELRDFLDLYNYKDSRKEIKYKKYSDLKKRVITPAINELKALAESGNSDFWIDIQGIGKVKEGSPERFLFQVYYSELGKHSELLKEKQKEDRKRDEFLASKLYQTPSNIRKINQRVVPDMEFGFRQEMERLYKVISERKDIANPRAFVWASLDAWIEDHLPRVVEEEKEQAVLPKEPVQGELFTEETPGCNDPRWDNLMDYMRKNSQGNDFSIWFAPCLLYAVGENSITIKVPTQFVSEYIERFYGEKLKEGINKFFGENCELYFCV